MPLTQAEEHTEEWRQGVVNCCNALMTQYQALLKSSTVGGGEDDSGSMTMGADEVERVVRVMLDERKADEEATRMASVVAAGKGGEEGDRGGELPAGVISGVDIMALKGALATENIAEVVGKLLELIQQLEVSRLMSEGGGGGEGR